MGLLSDPSLTRRSKLSRSLAQHSGKISSLFYVAGLAWFVVLSHPDFNHRTYLSENALSPGLVYPEIQQTHSRLAQSLLDELRREHEEHKSTTPHAWIAAKMRQIGLETHVHEFRLRYPFSGGKEFKGKNVYGILRAPRIGSTEGIVFTAPYRAPASVHMDITASVPVLLAFADFARRKNYWAKDLIFLVTEQEQLGMQAWLEAYFEPGLQNRSALDSGNLPARAGALQAAVNLEIQDFDIDYIDVKIEGLNGQLPNLDMFNLVQHITSREGLPSGYKQTPRKKRRSTHANIEDNLKHMARMLLSQANGVPNGNHGLFHRYRIESLTLEAVKRTTNTNNNRNLATLPLLKTIEGISRSLNNLLERFHQSYFFYILVQNDRFVSIGDFMPCLMLMAAPMFLRAFLLWITLNDDSPIAGAATADTDAEQTAAEKKNNKREDLPLPFPFVLLYMGAALGLGQLCNALLLDEHVRDYLSAYSGVGSAVLLLIAMNCVGVAAPFCVKLPAGGLELLHIGTLLLLGVALIIVGLLNFALGFLVAIVVVPLAILFTSDDAGRAKSLRKSVATVYALLLNPCIVIYLLVFVQTLFQFPEATLKEMATRALTATSSAISFALMDRIIYGNWLYTAATTVFFPLWVLCWTLALSMAGGRQPRAEKLKIN